MSSQVKFCNKVSRMLGPTLKLTELSPDYFRVEITSAWLKTDQSIYLNDEFMDWVSTYCLRNLKKRVKWDNLNVRFWFEDL
jgi:hypothetical protein